MAAEDPCPALRMGDRLIPIVGEVSGDGCVTLNDSVEAERLAGPARGVQGLRLTRLEPRLMRIGGRVKTVLFPVVRIARGT